MTQYIGAVPESAKMEVITINQPSRQNIIINSDFNVNQRGYAGTALAINAFGYDRYRSEVTNSTMSVSGIVATVDNTTGSTNGHFYQGIEAGKMIVGRQYTVSWKGDAEVAVYYANGGSYVWHSEPFTFVAGTGISTVDEYIAFRGDGATISEIKLEEGTSATPWEKPDIATELARCQRYFLKILPGASGDYVRIGMGYWYGATGANIYVQFSQEMRAAPTVSYEGALSNYLINLAGGLGTASPTSIAAFDTETGQSLLLNVGYTTGGQTAGQGTSLMSAPANTTNGLLFDAEL